MIYDLNGHHIDLNSDSAEALLIEAHANRTRLKCLCRTPYPEMYLAKVEDKIIVKRMPDTGHEHDPSCPSFDPPEELSGLSQVNGSAIQSDEEATHLKLDFPLSMRGKKYQPRLQVLGKTKPKQKVHPRN